MHRIGLTAMVVVGVGTWALGEDFNQWRGPQRNGVTTGGPALDIRWGKTGPTRMWESDTVPGTVEYGSGCVSVAGGKAYVYVHWKYLADIPTRTLTESDLRRLGWTDRKMPVDIVKAVEEARVAPDLEKLTGRTRAEWIKKWADAHVTTASDTRPVFAFVTDRLSRGKTALPLDVLDTLATIKAKPFPDAVAFNAWFAENGVADVHKDAVLKVVRTAVGKSWDTLVCLNIADGKTVWKKQFDGAPAIQYPYGASSTPTVIDGRCYFLGSKNDVYCVDAATGDEVWQVKINPAPSGWTLNHSSPLVIDGKVIVAAGKLTALEASQGTVIWQQPKATSRENSPIIWQSGERTFLLCNTAGFTTPLHCVDLQDGKIVWSVPAGGSNTPAVAGDYLVTAHAIPPFAGDATKYGLIAYKLSVEKAEKLWSVDKYSAGGESPLILDGYVYNFGPGVAVCIEVATGKVAWEEKGPFPGWRSPVLADGKLITAGGGGIMVIRATPEKYELLGQVRLPIGQYTSPSVADGRLYLRQQKNVACYDLTRPTVTTTTTAPTQPAPKP